LSDDVLLSLLKKGIAELDKSIGRVVLTDEIEKNLELKKKINSAIFSLCEELHDSQMFNSASDKKTFRMIKKNIKGTE
jgi:hypothetical protein